MRTTGFKLFLIIGTQLTFGFSPFFAKVLRMGTPIKPRISIRPAADMAASKSLGQRT